MRACPFLSRSYYTERDGQASRLLDRRDRRIGGAIPARAIPARVVILVAAGEARAAHWLLGQALRSEDRHQRTRRQPLDPRSLLGLVLPQHPPAPAPLLQQVATRIRQE